MDDYREDSRGHEQSVDVPFSGDSLEYHRAGAPVARTLAVRTFFGSDYARRVTLALPQAVLALGVYSSNRVLSVLLAIDLVIVLAPWQTPRHNRSDWSFWFETLLYLFPLATIAAAMAIRNPEWLSLPSSPAPYLLGVILGMYLVQIGGVPVSAVLRGDVASLQGGARPWHCAARGTQIAVAGPLEEIAFRGALGLATPSVVLVALAPAVFVLRHHLVRGMPTPRFDRSLYLRTTYALLALSVAYSTDSVWPCIIAHVLSNLPMAVVEFQRAYIGFSEES